MGLLFLKGILYGVICVMCYVLVMSDHTVKLRCRPRRLCRWQPSTGKRLHVLETSRSTAPR